MDKKQLSERDICTKYITPAIEKAGWDRHTHFLEEVFFTDGKIYVRLDKLTSQRVKEDIISAIENVEKAQKIADIQNIKKL
jgi:type I restriction enzyme R subunit